LDLIIIQLEFAIVIKSLIQVPFYFSLQALFQVFLSLTFLSLIFLAPILLALIFLFLTFLLLIITILFLTFLSQFPFLFNFFIILLKFYVPIQLNLILNNFLYNL